MKQYILASLFTLISPFIFSQESVIDSVDVIRATKITPSIKKYIQYTENSNGAIRFSSILTREIQKSDYNNNNSFLIIQKYQTPKGVDIDSSFVDAITLKPIAYHTNISSQNYKEIVEFSKKEILNQIIYKDSTNVSVEQNNQFFNGVITNDLIGELPLKAGKTFVLKMVNPGKRYNEYITTVKVLGIETVELNATTKIKCWKLKVIFGAAKKGNTEWYSLDSQTQIKSVFEFGKGNKFIRTMIVQ